MYPMYVLFSMDETRSNRNLDGEPMFWSCKEGWVSLEHADLFVTSEMGNWEFPDGVWLQIPDSNKKHNSLMGF